MLNTIDIYANRTKLMVSSIIQLIGATICLALSGGAFWIAFLIFTKNLSKPVPQFMTFFALFMAIGCAFMGYSLIIHFIRYSYILKSNKPLIRIDNTDIHYLVGPHTLIIPWSNIAHLSLGAFAHTKQGHIYQNMILIHILHPHLLDQKAYSWIKNAFSSFNGIMIGDVTTIPVNELFVLLKKYKNQHDLLQ